MIYILTAAALLLLLVFVLILVLRNRNKNDIKNTAHYRKDILVNGGADIKTGQIKNSDVSSFNGMEFDKYETVVMYDKGHAYGPKLSSVYLINIKTGERFEANFNNSLVIGRGSSNVASSMLVVSEDKSVSGAHCEIFVSAGRTYVKDLGSSNHTYLNGNQVFRPEVIKSGDTLKLGRSPFKIMIG